MYGLHSITHGACVTHKNAPLEAYARNGWQRKRNSNKSGQPLLHGLPAPSTPELARIAARDARLYRELFRRGLLAETQRACMVLAADIAAERAREGGAA